MKKQITKVSIVICVALVMVLVTAGSGFAGSSSSSSSESEITITMTGDLMCDTKFQKYLYDEESKTFDFDGTFKYVKEIFKDSDFTVGNLETCVAPSKALSRDLHFKNNQPYMNAPRKFLRALKRAGFDGFILANNHTLDTGTSGIKETLQSIDDLGLKHTGLYTSSKDKRYFILKKNGIKVAFLAYATHYNYRDYSLTVNDQKRMLAKFSQANIKADVKAARKAGAQYFIAYMHAGSENTYKVSDQQKTMANALAKAGVDFIVGSHPHWVQRKATYHDGDKKVPTIYSMGNFTGKLRSAKTRETVILTVTLKKDSNGNVSLKKKKYTPVYMMTKWNGGKMVLLPEGYKCKTKKNQDKIDSHFEHIRKVLNNEN